MKTYLTAGWVAVGAVWAMSGSAQAASSPLVGAWKLTAYQVESQDTRKMIPAMGEHPTGRVIFTEDHRVAFVLTAEGRKPGSTDADKASLLNTLVAYTGVERVDGNQWCTQVESAWNPEWVGTTQCREFHVEGDRLQVLTGWRQMPNWPGTTRSIITFQRDR